MAAIHISDENAWVAARWVVEYVLKAARAHLESKSAIAHSIDAALASGGEWLDLSSLSAESQEEFRDVIVSVCAELDRSTRADFATAEARDALLARAGELLALLKR